MRNIAIAIGILAIAFVLSACTSNQAQVIGASAEAQTPRIRIASPASQEVIDGNEVRVRVEVTGFILDNAAIGTPSVPGRGHWHVYLDGEWIAATGELEYALDRVAQGPHHLKVALANNDHSLLDPSVEDSVVIDRRSGEAAGEPGKTEEYSGGDKSLEESIPAVAASPHFVSSSPAHGEELHQMPERVVISFDFKLAPESSIELTHDGAPVGTGPVVIAPDQFSMSAPIDEGGSPGIYEVAYRACWPLMNCHKGSFAFIVEPKKDTASGEGYY